MNHRIQTRRRRLSIVLSIVTVAGCSSLGQLDQAKWSSLSNKKPKQHSLTDRASNAEQNAKISNPPAKHIRFEGQESLLGGGEFQSLAAAQFHQAIGDLLVEQRYRTAALMVHMHGRSARSLLLEKSAQSDDPRLDFIAQTLDAGAETAHWHVHLERCRQSGGNVPDITSLSLGSDPSALRSAEDTLETIRQQTSAAKSVGSIPLAIEAERLLALADVSRGQLSEGLERLASVAEYATQAGLAASASELWLMSAELSLRLEQVEQARQCWRAAVATQLASIRSRDASQAVPAIDAPFWEQSDRLRHPEDSWPAEIVLAFSPWLRKIGITDHETITPHVALWAAITEYQLAIGQPHTALLSVKRAETEASPSVKPWLSIASARALAAQGQVPVATTILTQVAQSEDHVIRGAALSTLGTIKIQSGAYEQGAKFLAEGLNSPSISRWPGYLAARADFVLVELIVGKSEEILPKLHTIQNELLISNQWQSLVQSLENEAAIMKHEKQDQLAAEIKKRIVDIETLRVTNRR